MNNYQNTRKLLSEPTFLEVVSNLYEDFISLDLNEYDFYRSQEMSFYLSLQNWTNRYKDSTKTRLFNGYMGAFSVYASEKLIKMIMDDWSTFHKQLEGQANISKMVTQFKAETLEFIRLIPLREHLTLIADKLIKVLTRIAEHEELKVITPGITENGGVALLRWGGQLDTLYTLFYDLMNKTSRETGRIFINANKEEVIAFIMANFVNYEGEPLSSATSIKTYLEPSRPEKKAKKERFVLQYDYEDPKSKK